MLSVGYSGATFSKRCLLSPLINLILSVKEDILKFLEAKAAITGLVMLGDDRLDLFHWDHATQFLHCQIDILFCDLA